MNYSSIQSAILSGIATRQILQGLASMNFETKAVTQINIVEERITDVIAVLINLQEELINLLTENRELRTQVRNNKADRDMNRSA